MIVTTSVVKLEDNNNKNVNKSFRISSLRTLFRNSIKSVRNNDILKDLLTFLLHSL